jgi:hypothetical protein
MEVTVQDFDILSLNELTAFGALLQKQLLEVLRAVHFILIHVKARALADLMRTHLTLCPR